MIARWVLLLSLFSVTSAGVAQAKPAAGVSGALSIIPGLGQVGNGDIIEGLVWFPAVVGAFLIRPGIGFDLWMYNMYDAYRDAEPEDKKFTTHNVFYNYIANFNPLNIVDPIGAPLLIGYGVVPGVVRYHFRNVTPRQILGCAFIGLGEESLFRGFLFPGFTYLLKNSTIAGALVSSALFGAVHVQYNIVGKVVVGLVGLVFSWQAHRNQYDLRKNIFAHSWIDVFLIPPGKGPLSVNPFEQPQQKIPGIPPVGVALNFQF